MFILLYFDTERKIRLDKRDVFTGMANENTCEHINVHQLDNERTREEPKRVKGEYESVKESKNDIENMHYFQA